MPNYVVKIAETVAKRATSSSRKLARAAMARTIIDAAENVFIEEGFAGFGMRPVAAAACMSLGTLQYYFPSADDLLIATVRSLQGRHLEAILAIVCIKTELPQVRLLRLLEYVYAQVHEPRACKMTFELLALAQREKQVRAVMREAYDVYRREIAHVVGGINPGLSTEERVARATVIASQLEGLMFYTYAGGSTVGNWSAITRECTRGVLHICGVDEEEQARFLHALPSKDRVLPGQ